MIAPARLTAAALTAMAALIATALTATALTATAAPTAATLTATARSGAALPPATARGHLSARPVAATSAPIPTLALGRGALQSPEPAAVGSASLETTSSGSAGAVTFVNENLVAPAPVDVTVAGIGAGAGSGGEAQIAAGHYTTPQLLPAGTYAVTVSDAATGVEEARSTLTVVAGSDLSLVISGLVAANGQAGVQISQAPDATNDVSPGAAVISLRNQTSRGVDIYFDGSLGVTDTTGGSFDVTVSARVHQVTVVRAGATAATGTLYSGYLTVDPDSLVALYLLDDPASPGGITAGTTPFVQGYQYTASDGGLFDYGSYPFLGSTGTIGLERPVVGGAEETGGAGYWLVASDGGVFAFDAPFLGSLGNVALNQPIVGMAATIGPNGKPGYLLVARDGGVFAFNAAYHGSLGGTGRTDVVGIATDPSTGGYIVAEADGSSTRFGPGITPTPTAPIALDRPIVGVTETPDGGGAWLVAADGGVFSLGDAAFFGSTGSLRLNRPVIGLFPTFDGLGYDLVAADGGVFAYGNAKYFGSTGATVLNEPIVGVVAP